MDSLKTLDDMVNNCVNVIDSMIKRRKKDLVKDHQISFDKIRRAFKEGNKKKALRLFRLMKEASRSQRSHIHEYEKLKRRMLNSHNVLECSEIIVDTIKKLQS